MATDLDYLTARLHGRRSRLAEAQRLDELCRIRSIAELCRAIYPDAEFQEVIPLQRRLVQELVDEVSDLLPHLSAAGAGLLRWALARFYVENLKVMIRGILSQTPLDLLRAHWVSLAGDLLFNTQSLASAQSLQQLVQLMPPGKLRASAEQALKLYGETTQPFFLEATLDQAYFQELLGKLEHVPEEEMELIKPLVLQEIDSFHLMLVVRGKFHYNLSPELLLSLHVPGTRIPRARFAAMFSEPDLLSAVRHALGRAIDAVPLEPGGATATRAAIDPAALEALAWNRFWHLANRAFRRSHFGLGAVIGFVGIRRVEVANLITLSEGIRTGMAAETIRKRLIPRPNLESVYA